MKSPHDWTPRIAVDFDGTLVEYHGWQAWNIFGPFIPLMKARVEGWLAGGEKVVIFTARAAYPSDYCRVTQQWFSNADVVNAVQNHLESGGLPRLEVTAIKTPNIKEFWDDRAIQVLPNTGRTLAEEHLSELTALKGKL